MHPDTAQLALPGALKVPGAQLMQVALELAPSCVEAVPGSHDRHTATESSTAPYKPAVQCEHASLEVSPMEKIVVPTMHVPTHWVTAD
jgi:hypothetical protein